jgi:hypothetical protein
VEGMGERDNEPTDLDEDGLDAAVPVPVGEDGQFGRVDFAVDLRNEGKVDARGELDRGRPVGVILIAVYLERIDPVLVHRLKKKIILFLLLLLLFSFSNFQCHKCAGPRVRGG